MNVLRLAKNTTGRDFVVGDIHGCFDQLIAAMNAVGFDEENDRLLSLGDLVDRGPGSNRAWKFLAKPYVHAIRGNHEDMFLEIADANIPDQSLPYVCRSNGMQWFPTVSREDREKHFSAFREMPIAIEVETELGRIGLVHADVPTGYTWDDFAAELEAENTHVIQHALWSRDRIESSDDTPVEGIERVYVGHSPVLRPAQLGNIFHIDTGAVFGVLRNDPVEGYLTMANVDVESTLLLSPPDPVNFVCVACDDMPSLMPVSRF